MGTGVAAVLIDDDTQRACWLTALVAGGVEKVEP
jgi:hypothetical protein